MIDKLGCTVGMLGDPENPGDISEAVHQVEAAGYESAWTWESFGPDCFTPLAWWGSRSKNMRLGTAVAQMAARPPTAMAMAAMTLDKLSGGRVVIGLGVSGPQVVEGWYGMPFERPLGWTREYIDIMKQTMRRDRVALDGKTYQLPIQGGSGLGRSIRTALRDAPRTEIPIYLGAEGPKNISLAAEIADGWLPTNFSPLANDWYQERLEIGFTARGGRPEHFEIAPAASISIGPDTETAAARLKPGIAFQVGANGAESANFHLNAVARLGFDEACKEIQAKFLERDREGMAAAVPTEMVEAIALVGTPEKIKADLAKWHNTVATSFIARARLEDLVTLAEIFRSTTSEPASV